MRKAREGEKYDLVIDGHFWIIEGLAELQFIKKRTDSYKGVDFEQQEKDIALRLWSEMGTAEQARFERSVYGRSLNINYDKERGKGAR